MTREDPPKVFISHLLRGGNFVSSLARLRPVEDKTVEKSCPPSFCAVWIGQSTANVPFLAPRVVRGFSGRKGGTAGSTGKTGPVAEKRKAIPRNL